MARLAAFAVALAALAACDSAAPIEPDADAIVGTWSFVSVTSEERGTVSRTQTILDATSPGTSTVRVTGDESGDLDVLASVNRYDGGMAFSLLSYDPDGVLPARPLDLAVSDEPSYRSLRLQVQADDYATYYADGGIGSRMVRDGWTYRFDDVPLVTYDGRQATLTGAFTFATRTLPAGQSTALNIYRYGYDPAYRLDYTFGADGQLTVREGSGNASIERVGTWVRSGDRVELRTPAENGTATFILVYTARVEGAVLTLTDERPERGCTGQCLQSYEQAYGLEPGTLTAIESASTFHFTKSPAASARTSDAAPGSPLPPALREQLLLGPSR